MTEVTGYCRNCGHPKEDHNLNVHGDPKHAHLHDKGDGACHDMSGDHHCICVEFESWESWDEVHPIN